MRKFLLLLSLLLLMSPAGEAQQPDRLKIGVTLRAYHSWVLNIVGEHADVISVTGMTGSPHDYQPNSKDIKRLSELDVIVINGIGHDSFIFNMIKASAKPEMLLIEPNRGLALIPVRQGSGHHRKEGEKEEERGGGVNSHTFVSINSAITQIRAIARQLAELDRANADLYSKNARAYIKTLRTIKKEAIEKLGDTFVPPAVATIHDGYSYFFQELMFDIVAVIEPAHGIQPSAKELARMIKQIQGLDVDVIFSELEYPDSVVKAIEEEADVRVRTLDHVSSGEWNKERFERALQFNFDVLVELYGREDDE